MSTCIVLKKFIKPQGKKQKIRINKQGRDKKKKRKIENR